MPEASVDSIVTDPPYGLSFMGRKWDYDLPEQSVWEEAMRVAKPGAHLLAFGGTRTFHRLAVSIEDAGWDIRDCVMWVYGSGFPKSHDVSKAIDREAGAKREVIGPGRWNHVKGANENQSECLIRPGGKHDLTAPATDEARQWQGWGTALKPAWEPVIVARKPLDGTVAENVLRYGTGALNIDGCRVAGEPSPSVERRAHAAPGRSVGATGWETPARPASYNEQRAGEQLGRWPANLVHDGSQEVLALFPNYDSPTPHKTKRTKASSTGVNHQYKGGYSGQNEVVIGYGDTGSAARFFYCAKANKRDRDEGVQRPLEKFVQFQTANGTSGKPSSLSQGLNTQYRNIHPTVKPTDLMRYLCRLVTPPSGVVLDPFMGSGSTGKAAMLEGFQFIGIEREQEYLDIARERIEAVRK